MRRATWVSGVAAALLLAGTLAAAPAPAPAGVGFRIAETRPIAPGLEYLRMVRSGGPVVAHAVRLRRDAPLRLQTVLSNDRVGPPSPVTERTSDMCARVQCLAAVNGDFALPTSGQPVGGVARDGRVLRSPVASHHQLSVAGGSAPTAGVVGWTGQLVGNGLGTVPLEALNRERAGEGIFAFTPAYGPSTGTTAGGVELVARTLEVPLPLDLGTTGLVQLVELSDGRGDSAIPSDGLVLSAEGAGAAALRALWAGLKTAVLRLETSPAVTESIGGSPLLLRADAVVVADDGTGFTTGRHPRTLVGWNARETLLVAVDGRQSDYSIGLTLPDAARMLADLGATDAINLDGGGSTTLTVNGGVVNRPSDRLVRTPSGAERVVAEPGPDDTVLGAVERPVADALVIVGAGPLPILDDLLAPLLRPAPVAPAGRDPASRP